MAGCSSFFCSPVCVQFVVLTGLHFPMYVGYVIFSVPNIRSYLLVRNSYNKLALSFHSLSLLLLGGSTVGSFRHFCQMSVDANRMMEIFCLGLGLMVRAHQKENHRLTAGDHWGPTCKFLLQPNWKICAAPTLNNDLPRLQKKYLWLVVCAGWQYEVFTKIYYVALNEPF